MLRIDFWIDVYFTGSKGFVPPVSFTEVSLSDKTPPWVEFSNFP